MSRLWATPDLQLVWGLSESERFGTKEHRVKQTLVLLQYCHDYRYFSRSALSDPMRWYASRIGIMLEYVLQYVLFLYMFLYLFEVPAWCWAMDSSCGDPAVIPRSDLSSRIPIDTSRWLLLILLAILMTHEVTVGFAAGFYCRWSRMSIAVMSFAFLDILVAIINGSGLPPRNIYWSPLLRPLVFLGQSRSAQKFLRYAFEALTARQVVQAGLGQGLLLAFWSWFGIVLFARTEEGEMYFGSLEVAARSLFIMFTTANFPDVMMPAYNRCRFVILYFSLYLILSLYMLFNIFLAAMFRSYKATAAHRLAERTEQVRVSLDTIFDGLLDETGGVPEEIWEETFIGFVGVSNDWNRQRAALLLQLAKRDTKPGLDRSSWHRLGSVLANPDVVCVSRAPSWTPPHLFNINRLFAVAVDILVCLDLGATLLQTHYLLDSRSTGWRDEWPIRLTHAVCSVVYVAELVFRFASLSWDDLRRDTFRNSMDLMTGLACTILGLFAIYLKSFSLYRALALVRVLRAERVLWRIEGVRQSLRLVTYLLSTFRSTGSALILVFYIFSTIGVQLFGGLVRTDNPSLQGTDFGQAAGAGYYVNNFNDFASGIVVLFELMVVNNWFVIANGLATVMQEWYRVAWFFCIAFYFCIHPVILNILVTSIVEVFERLSLNEFESFSASGRDARLADEPEGDVAPQIVGEDELMLEDASPSTTESTSRSLIVQVLEGYLAKAKRRRLCRASASSDINNEPF